MPIQEFAKDHEGSMRNMIMVVDEQIKNECDEPRQMVWFVDATVEQKPMVVSHFTVPEASGNFCQRGGRFGSHSSNESMAPVFYRKLAFVTWFNAGVPGAMGGPEAPEESWEEAWRVNVMAHVWAARALLPEMLGRGEGYLINTASAAGLLTQVSSLIYSVTKHAAG